MAETNITAPDANQQAIPDQGPALVQAPRRSKRARNFLLYLRRNPPLITGTILLLLIAVFVVIGALVTEPADAQPLAFRPSQEPSAEHWLGTDRLGKDILAVMVEGTPQTIRIGLIAGAIGVAIGTILAFFSGYYGARSIQSCDPPWMSCVPFRR